MSSSRQHHRQAISRAGAEGQDHAAVGQGLGGLDQPLTGTATTTLLSPTWATAHTPTRRAAMPADTTRSAESTASTPQPMPHVGSPVPDHVRFGQPGRPGREQRLAAPRYRGLGFQPGQTLLLYPDDPACHQQRDLLTIGSTSSIDSFPKATP